MLRPICLVFIVLSLLLFGEQQNNRLSKYRAIETYEIRPGVLVMPKYSEGGRFCEIVLEKHHYANATAQMDSTISREVIAQIVDELAPLSERGALTTNTGREYLSAYSGNTVTTFADYRNVSIRIFGIASPADSAGDIVAVVHWNNRNCK